MLTIWGCILLFVTSAAASLMCIVYLDKCQECDKVTENYLKLGERYLQRMEEIVQLRKDLKRAEETKAI